MKVIRSKKTLFYVFSTRTLAPTCIPHDNIQLTIFIYNPIDRTLPHLLCCAIRCLDGFQGLVGVIGGILGEFGQGGLVGEQEYVTIINHAVFAHARHGLTLFQSLDDVVARNDRCVPVRIGEKAALFLRTREKIRSAAVYRAIAAIALYPLLLFRQTYRAESVQA